MAMEWLPSYRLRRQIGLGNSWDAVFLILPNCLESQTQRNPCNVTAQFSNGENHRKSAAISRTDCADWPGSPKQEIFVGNRLQALLILAADRFSAEVGQHRRDSFECG
jgi:hypothetical protein